MKTKLKSITIIIFLLLILFSILYFPKEAIDSVLFGINIWSYNVFPALFPFFIIADLLVNYGFIEFLSEIFKNLMIIFGLSGNCSFALLGSIVSGFPSGAKYTKQLLEEEKISVQEANHLIRFTHFSNPLFIMGTIGAVLLKNKKLGIIILLAHFLGNLIIGIIFRPKCNYTYEKVSLKRAIDEAHKKRINNNKGFANIISDAIYNTINILILLLGIIIIFLIITNLITKIFTLNETFSIIIKGICEMTQGVKFAAGSHFSILTKIMLITSFLSFGGLSVHLQTSSIISNTKIKYKNFLLARIIHSFIATVLVYIFYVILYFSNF